MGSKEGKPKQYEPALNDYIQPKDQTPIKLYRGMRSNISNGTFYHDMLSRVADEHESKAMKLQNNLNVEDITIVEGINSKKGT